MYFNVNTCAQLEILEDLGSRTKKRAQYYRNFGYKEYSLEFSDVETKEAVVIDSIC